MKKDDLKNSNFVIDESSSIQQAMEAMTDNQRGSVIIVDKDFYVEGIIADGDIRRAMVGGMTIIAPVSKIINTNPVTLSIEEYKGGMADKIFDDKTDIGIIPVVDNNKLVDIAVRNPEKRKDI